ncbi:globin CTT-VI-like [Culicoides brevitarsis]|uniref:globin CTT-VI-like n=1 Tax=Culicoides brevitarsis TaxID=469753 RepID=UPI00307C1176
MENIPTEHILLVKKTWEKASSNLFDFSDEIMYRYFRKYPEYLRFFPKFAEISLDDLKGKAIFRAHGSRIVSQISTAVDCLDHDGGLDEIKDFWHKIGELHRRKRINKQQLLQLRDVIIAEVLEANVGSYSMREIKQAWIKFFAVMYAPAFDTIEMMNWKEYFGSDVIEDDI